MIIKLFPNPKIEQNRKFIDFEWIFTINEFITLFKQEPQSIFSVSFFFPDQSIAHIHMATRHRMYSVHMAWVRVHNCILYFSFLLSSLSLGLVSTLTQLYRGSYAWTLQRKSPRSNENVRCKLEIGIILHWLCKTILELFSSQFSSFNVLPGYC